MIELRMKLKGELIFWRFFLKGKVQDMVQFKSSIYSKLLQSGPYVSLDCGPHPNSKGA